MLGLRYLRFFAVFTVFAVALSACMTKTETRGFRFQDAPVQVTQGMSQEEVLLTLGTPSTTATFETEVFYYISQKKRTTAFMLERTIDQRVLAVTFGADGRVSEVADYGLKDGVVFDFINRRTPTGGREQSFIEQIFSNLSKPPSPYGS